MDQMVIGCTLVIILPSALDNGTLTEVRELKPVVDMLRKNNRIMRVH